MNSVLKQLIVCATFSALALVSAAQSSFTEIISPRHQPGMGFGWGFGGLPDLTRDGVGEFYVLETSRVYIYDGASLQPLYWIDNPGGDIGNPTHSAGDLNGDGIPELLVTRGNNGLGQVSVVNGTNGVELFRINSPNPANLGFFGTTLRLLPDMTGDGHEDWLIHQPEFQARVGRVYVFDSQTTNAVRTIENAEAQYRFWMNFVEVIPDVNRDGKPELVVAGQGRAVVRSLETGTVLYEILNPEPSAPGGFANVLKGIGDITGDGIGDIAIGNFMRSNNTGVVYFFNGTNGQWLRTLRSPNPRVGGKFGRAIEVLPGLNGDGVPELWTQEDGFQLTYVFDGATSVLLKTVPYPGVFNTLFFTGVVRQQAAPGLRAYLFASEFVNNAEGRVYFMPFTPIQPTQLRAIGKTNSAFRLQVSGESGLKLSIQGTSDFKTWETVTNLTTGTQPTELEDSAATAQPQRFYRTVQRE